MASELYNTIDALSREKGIDPQIVVSAVEDAMDAFNDILNASTPWSAASLARPILLVEAPEPPYNWTRAADYRLGQVSICLKTCRAVVERLATARRAIGSNQTMFNAEFFRSARHLRPLGSLAPPKESASSRGEGNRRVFTEGNEGNEGFTMACKRLA